jgi:ABC-type uncharacterized transport system permease subunit
MEAMDERMDRWYLLVSTLFALAGGAWGLWSVLHGKRSRWTLATMIGVFGFQLAFLSSRGEARGACPLRDTGEILVFLAWSLTMFYLIVGPAYRISLLGVFTAPVVVIFQSAALFAGLLESDPERVTSHNFWGEIHAAVSVLAYGALALAAVAGVMFLVLDRLLKEHHLTGGMFRNLPPARELLVSLQRLLWLGGGLLTLGIIAGILMPRSGSPSHLIVASLVWLGYAALIAIQQIRGLTGRRLSWCASLGFVVSLLVFAFI